MKKLRCTNEECEGQNEDPIFNLNVTVGQDGDLAESTKKIEGHYFVCCYCFSDAKWVEVEDRFVGM